MKLSRHVLLACVVMLLAAAPRVYAQTQLDVARDLYATADYEKALGLLDGVIAHTEGNPFFLEEMVRTLVETRVFVGEQRAYRLAADSARINRSAQWARLMAIPCRRLFAGRPLSHLQVPTTRDHVSDSNFAGRNTARPAPQVIRLRRE